MLNTIKQNEITNLMESLPQLFVETPKILGIGPLQDALHKGWQILETAEYLAHGKNTEGKGQLFTLYNPRLSMTRELYVAYA